MTLTFIWATQLLYCFGSHILLLFELGFFFAWLFQNLHVILTFTLIYWLTSLFLKHISKVWYICITLSAYSYFDTSLETNMFVKIMATAGSNLVKSQNYPFSRFLSGLQRYSLYNYIFNKQSWKQSCRFNVSCHSRLAPVVESQLEKNEPSLYICN